MNKIAVIGGSCFAALKNLAITHSTAVVTPYGEPCAPLSYGILGEQEVVYLLRRGPHIAPHKINYRANIWALKEAGVETIIAIAAVTGIRDTFQIGDIVIPDQLIDYTYGRENTFIGEDPHIAPIDFAEPYSQKLREKIIEKANELNYPVFHQATYGITQGPRLETKAEIARLAKDGCHVIGMTGMPEAALARELNLNYACIALVVRKEETFLEQLPDLAFSEQRVQTLVEQVIVDKN